MILRRKNFAYALLLTLCVAVLTVFGGFPLFQPQAFAAIPKLDTIRVALFIDTAKYHDNSPKVTISSDKGLSIGLRSQAGIHTWIDNASLKSMRTSIDSYMVQLLETTDYTQAQGIKQKLNSESDSAYIYRRVQQGKPLFQVWVGPYSSKDAAAAAKDGFVRSLGLSASPSLKLTGPLHWNAGSYATETEALSQQSMITQAGINADLVYQENAAGTAVYSVWIGSEADADGLNALKQQVLALLPKLVLQAVDINAPYLLKRDDRTKGPNDSDAVAHFMFNPNAQKVWITPKQGKLTLLEKENQSYRGSIELSQFNGKLAVINELPFEQYLYVVVASEMSTGWPLEALKAQAVAARTYALQSGMKYGIAHISDSTADQAYLGLEYDDVTKAVDATKGEVITDQNGLVTPYYSSNTGGMTADPSEVWGGSSGYLKGVSSPDDGAAKEKGYWYRVVLADGTIGYVKASLMHATGTKNASGLPYYAPNDPGINVRTAPYVNNVSNAAIVQLNHGDQVIVFDETIESNSYNWQRGPIDASKLNQQMYSWLGKPMPGVLQSLTVSKRGPSGRVIELKVNGQIIKLSSPDSYRSLLGSLPSTLFDIVETGRYTVLGANGVKREAPESVDSLYVISGSAASASTPVQKQMFVMNGDRKARLVTMQPQFIFTGKGFGHGLGMSQWGARGFAEQGYNYQQILKAYYSGITISKQ